MRILILSSFYPPLHAGGYDQLCWEVVQELETRGHSIAILTSRSGVRQPTTVEPGIHRELFLDGDLNYYKPIDFFLHWKGQQVVNREIFERRCSDFKPDIVFLWGMWALSKDLIAYIEDMMPDQVVYYLAGHWPARESSHASYWGRPAHRWYLRLPKRILAAVALKLLKSEGPASLAFRRVICVSHGLRELLVQSGLPLQDAQIIYNGIRIEDFYNINTRLNNRQAGGQLKLLYAGQLASHKGVHTAIKAVATLIANGEVKNCHLTIIGKGHPDYNAALQRLVTDHKLSDHVTFAGYIPRAEFAAILPSFDILVFPSLYAEPLARIVQEAMAAGLVVIGTPTGGTTEIIHDGQNGLIFPAGYSAGLAECIARLNTNHVLWRKLVTEGQQTVLSEFSLDLMVDKIEAYLQQVRQDIIP